MIVTAIVGLLLFSSWKLSLPDVSDTEVRQFNDNNSVVRGSTTPHEKQPSKASSVELIQEHVPLQVWSLCPVADWPELVTSRAVGYDPEVADSLSVSDECEEAFDQYIRQKELISSDLLQFLQFRTPMTLARIFEDSKGDRDRVKEALSRPECLVKDNDGIRLNLRESCHADSISNFLLFNKLCQNPPVNLFWFDAMERPPFTYWRHVIVADEPAHEQQGQHWKNWLAQRWVANICEQYDLDSLVMDSDRDKVEYEVLATFRKKLTIRELMMIDSVRLNIGIKYSWTKFCLY